MTFEGYEEFEDMLFDYVTGELTDEMTASLEAEMERSLYLRQELKRYEELVVILAAAAGEELRASDGLAGRVGRRVAIKSYLAAATNIAEGLLGDYGRAMIYYLRLS